MEVHQHSHTPRKRWTHYIWEFLMLFLAVFCGFLAEYQLEHKIEKERGKQYLRSFVEDLKTDTSVFSSLIQEYEEKTSVLATMVDCYDAVVKHQQSDTCVLKLFLASANFPDFIYTDRTLQQLKNAGGLRLIARVDADSITEYDKLLRRYQQIETTSYQEIQSAIRGSITALNNFGTTVRAWFNSSTGPAPADKTAHPSILFSPDKDLLNKYFNQLFFYYTGTLGNLIDLQQINERAKSLISFFNKKYNLK